MEVLNNHQLVKRNRKVIFHYRAKEHFSSHEHKSPLRFDSYSLSGNDLILTHEKYDGRAPDALDAFRDWRLLNVDRKACNPKKLESLVNDLEIEEIKIMEIKYGKKIVFFSKQQVYVFKCENIEQEIRGHNRNEILDMRREKEEYVDELQNQNILLYKFITRLSRFVNGESRDHRNLLEFNKARDISLATKSAHYLEMLARVKDKLEDLKQTLPEDMLKYHGI